jgi:hypothetical protein
MTYELFFICIKSFRLVAKSVRNLIQREFNDFSFSILFCMFHAILLEEGNLTFDLR